jgi:putative ABC transport system permease protein
MDILRQDIRYSVRMLLRNPGTTAVAMLSLALGIGANTAIFSLMNAVVLRPLPVRNPAQLVKLSTLTPANPEREGALSLAMIQQLRKDQRVFSNLFAWTGGGIENVEASGVKYVASISAVSGEYFPTLGIQPRLGRWIAQADVSLDSGTSAAVAVIHYECWQRRYHGDPFVIGKTIRVEGHPLTIIGVTPESFSGLIIDAATDVIVPIGYDGATGYRNRKSLGLNASARLRPGVTLEQARAQMESLWPATLEASLPEGYSAAQRKAFLSRRMVVASGATGTSLLRRQYTRPLFVLMGMVGLLLLIACANLANLMLARAAGRRQEFGIRIALGAGRWRIVRQMLTESLLLSATGAALGLLMAGWASRLLLQTMWRGFIPLLLDASPDLRVLAFTALASLATGLLFGVAPAWKVVRADPAAALQHNARTVRGGTLTLGRVLIGGQVALSLVLVIGAVLFARSLRSLRSADVGFNLDGLTLFELFPTAGEMQPMPDRVAYFQDLAERLRGIPGVESVSYSHMGPVLSYEYTEPTSVSASVPASETLPLQAVLEAVGPGFFHLAGMRLLAGREFTWRDNETAQAAAIVSESLARRLFPSASPIGRRIDFGNRKNLEIVGVVNSASLWLPQSRKPLAVYLALMQMPAYNSTSIDIRTTGDPGPVLRAARRLIESPGRHLVLRAETVKQRAATSLNTDRMIAMLSSFFGGLALLLASVGLYGLMSYAVARRTSEIGLRMALGARPGGVLWLILKEVIWLLLAGLAVGIPAALAASHLISSMIHGVTGNDPLTILLACSILLAVAALAAYVPARRASRIDPMTALRSE